MSLDGEALAPAQSSATEDDSARPMLVVRGVTKTFPGVRAVDDVSLDVRAARSTR